MTFKPIIKAVFATDLQGGMGFRGTMPWPRLSGDMRNFKTLTHLGVVIMGRGTWDSDMPTPLPNRRNIVVTNNPIEQDPKNQGVILVSGTVPEIISLIRGCYSNYPFHWWVIGGARVLEQWLPYCHEVHHTLIEGVWECDTHFPQRQWQEGFRQTHTEKFSEKNISFHLDRWQNLNVREY